MASVLKGLDFAEVTRPMTAGDPLVKAKEKFVEAVNNQIALFKQGDNADPKARKWYFVSGGDYYVDIRFGNRPLKTEFGSTIKAGDKDKVPAVFKALIDACKSGELDKPIIEARTVVRKK